MNNDIKRPQLNNNLDASSFRNFYYLKQELVDFCRANGLPVSGDKIELTDRVAHFLSTGKTLPHVPKRKSPPPSDPITDDSVIEDNIVFSEKHRAFFVEKIGKTFSFNVPFQHWLKSNAGKTYADAVGAYYRVLEEKKHSKTAIGKQFEYNTYIRDFFADNRGKTLADAIVCWRYKKSLPGNNRYDSTDLIALKK